MPTNFTSPVGRMVQGDIFKPRTTDQQGNPLTIKSGPNAGQPRSDYFVAIAVPKDSPEWPAFKALVDAEAKAAWPQGQYNSPKFSNKIIDGDGMDDNGKPNSDKPGFAGCWVVRFSSGFAPTLWARSKVLPEHMRSPDPEAFVQVTDPSVLKRGYFIRVAGNVASNQNAQSPGLYMNYNMVELVGYGEEIVSGPTASQAFGDAPAALPTGAEAAAPTAAAPAASAPVPTPTASPSESPAPAPEPYTGYAEAPAPGPQMTAKANGVTYEAFIAKGWTDEQLKAQGYMA